MTNLLEILEQRIVSCLRRRQVAGLQRLAQLVHQLADLIFSTVAAVMMSMVAFGSRSLILECLLNFPIVLLRSRDISGRQVLGEFAKRLR